MNGSHSRRVFLSHLSRAAFAAATVPLNDTASAQSTTGSSRTGFVFDERYLEHRISVYHPECPARLTAIHNKFEQTGLIKELAPIPLIHDPLPRVKYVHSSEHIADIERIDISGEIAALAVAGTVGAVDAVCCGKVRNAFCAVRPPGHHALNTGREEGFCYYNNVAIAARHAQKAYGLGRVLVIDWDYHHGNGTEWAFYEDPTVLYFSTHDLRAYPGTGDPRKTGEGSGKGYNINVHLRCGATDSDMYSAWDKKLLPKVETFKPDLVLISAGFDSRKDDTLGCFDLSDSCFARLTETAMRIADSHAGGRLVSLLEGGYNISGLAEAAYAHVRTLADS